MKVFSIVLIVVGITIALIPLGQRVYTWYWQDRLLSEWEADFENNVENNLENNLDNEQDDKVVHSYYSLGDVFDSLIQQDEAQIVEEEEVEKEEEEEEVEEIYSGDSVSGEDEAKSINDENILGILHIDSIDVKLPIMRGTTERVLQVGVGKLEGTTPIGEFGNTALSAHRGHSYGRLFNRLDEVLVGDFVKIQTSQDELIYEVYDVKIVEPDDLSVLNMNKNEKILTLITCHPLYTSTHRLIVHGRLV